MDNLASAYAVLVNEGDAGPQRISGAQFIKLVKSLCEDFPDEVLDSLIQVLNPDGGVLNFKAFSAGVHACLLYEEFLVELQEFFVGEHSGCERMEWAQFRPWYQQLPHALPNIRVPAESVLQEKFQRAGGLTFVEVVQQVFSICGDTAKAESSH